MRHIYRLKYPNYDVNKNKIEIKNLHILFCLKGHAVSSKSNPPRCVLFCAFFQLLSVLFD